MTKPLSILSERFFQVRRSEIVLDAFFPRKKRSSAKSDIEQDLIDLSPLARLSSAIDRFRRESPDGTILRISYSFSTSVSATVSSTESDATFSSSSTTATRSEANVGKTTIERDIDFILRLVARDEKDLERLRKQFKDLLEFPLEFAEKAGSSLQSGLNLALAQVASGRGSGDISDSSDRSSGSLSAKYGLASSGNNSEISDKSIVEIDIKSIRELSISIEKVHSRLEVRSAQVRKIDPLVLDLDGNGYDLTPAGEGAIFDIDGDGNLDQTAWVRGGDALLVYDRNGNGRIDDGRELFGDQNGAANGFLELAKYDSNRDGKIDRHDSIFKALKLYRDLNGDGVIQAEELASLPQMGIAAIDLRFIRQLSQCNGNALLLEASFQRTDGTFGKIGDFEFGYKPAMNRNTKRK